MLMSTMLRLTFSLLATLATLSVAACQTATPPLVAGEISGRVLDVSGAPVAARLRVDEAVFETDADGRFAFSPTPELVYKIEIEADGYYPMRQTFSHAELRGAGQLNDITLVARKPGRTLMVFGGDAMIGRRFYQPFDGEPVLVDQASALENSKALLREMRPYLERADYASINLETPIFDAPPGPAAPKSVTFYSAPETLEALSWAGVDYVALGNNHTYDFLEPGLDITMEHLAGSNLDYSGAGFDEAQAVQPHRQTLAGTEFDFLSFVGWPAGTPSQSAEEGKGGAALGTSANLVEATRKSVSAGAFPVVQYHGGLEYVEEPTVVMETRLKQSADAGAGLIIGHHPHVTQGLELYDGTLIAWSLGNFLFDQYFYSAQSAALLYVWMDGDEFYHAELVPVYIKGYVPTPAVGPMRDMINQRVVDLSARRQTELGASGGHVTLSRQTAASLSQDWQHVETDVEGVHLRTGKDLLLRGDFDAHALFDAPDRSWLTLDERVSVVSKQDDRADFHLSAELAAGDVVTTGMRKFMRVYPRATPMSVRAELQTTANAQLDVYLQIRADGQALNEALEDGRKIKIGSVPLQSGETTSLDLDFDSPRVRARSIRVLMEFSAPESDAVIQMDDFKLIAWQTPFSGTSD